MQGCCDSVGAMREPGGAGPTLITREMPRLVVEVSRGVLELIWEPHQVTHALGALPHPLALRALGQGLAVGHARRLFLEARLRPPHTPVLDS